MLVAARPGRVETSTEFYDKLFGLLVEISYWGAASSIRLICHQTRREKGTIVHNVVK